MASFTRNAGGVERLFLACAVLRRRFPVGESPTRQFCSSRKQSEQLWR